MGSPTKKVRRSLRVLQRGCRHTWVRLRFPSLRERCRSCGLVFPCRAACDHLDCAEVQIQMGERKTWPTMLSYRILDADGNLIVDMTGDRDELLDAVGGAA